MTTIDLITTTVTNFSNPAPNQDDPTNFNPRMDSALGDIPNIVDDQNALAGEQNTMAGQMNTVAGEVAADKATIQALTQTTQAAANFKGQWAQLTGSLSVPASVSHAGKIWRLMQDMADVTTVEPGVTAGWEAYWLESKVLPDDTGKAGQFVRMDGDGNASLSLPMYPGFTLSGKTVFNTAITGYLFSVKISSTETLYAFQDGGDSNKGKAVVVTWGPTLSVSNKVEFSAAAATYITGCLFDSTHIFLCFSGTDNDGYASMLEWTGGTLSVVDKEFEWANSNTINTYNGCVPPPDNKIAIFYKSSIDNNLHGVVLGWSGSSLSVSVGTVVIYSALSVTSVLYDAKILKIDGSTANIVATVPSSAVQTRCLYIYWSGTALSLEDDQEIDRPEAGFAHIGVLSETNFVTLSGNLDGDQYYIQPLLTLFCHAGTQTDNFTKQLQVPLNFPIPKELPNGYVFYYYDLVVIDSNTIAVLYSTGNNTFTLQGYSITAGANLEDTEIEKIWEQEITRNAAYLNLTYAGSNQFLLGYRDSNNSTYGTVEKVEI